MALSVITAIINDSANQHYVGSQPWSVAAINHNRKCFPDLEVITEDSIEYKALVKAATPVYGDSVRQNWGFGTLANYLAMRRFLDGNGTELLWIEADMIRNQSVPFPDRYGVCMTKAWGRKDYTPTPYEIHKRKFCESYFIETVRPYNHMMSSWLRLERSDVESMIHELCLDDTDLFTTKAWEGIRYCERSIGVPEFRFVCDMVLELYWMTSNWTPENVFDSLGWVSYHDDYASKPIIHFDGPNKPNLVSYVESLGNA
jgi:hypothetical protein